MIRLFATALLLMLAACHLSEGNELGFRTSDPGRMAQIKQALSTRGIPFREDNSGTIIYDKQYKETFQAIVAELDSALAMRFEDPAHNALALKVLADMGIPGRIEKRPDGEWVAWNPRTAQEGREAQERIRAAFIASLEAKTAERCKDKSASATSTDSGRLPC